MKKSDNIIKNSYILKEIIETLEKNNTNISNDILDSIDSILENSKIEQELLGNLLIRRLIIYKKDITKLDKIILKKLKDKSIDHIKQKLDIAFSNKINELKECVNLKIDYTILQELLIQKDFQKADKITQQYLCKLSNTDKKNNRNWLYFTDIELIPKEDLFTIDLLWKIYSNNKFGISIQKKVWVINNENWDRFLEKIGWTEKGMMKRYPNDFIWTMDAPTGHLPLFNQLRGNQVLYHLFKYTSW
uniref:GUN4-like domain-containing protein n=1 Tax=Dasya naccarioides TaxID=2007180 RepID=A0A1Z1MGZ4_9FLOR|nr:hypothetical protein [Dasya naccarioides]ARW65095.1 hypothetical protein [Dasya naccarioides]